jgi:hypothetical protein
MTILIIGAVCIVAAIVGGGLKGTGWEFPVLTSKTSRWLLAGTGVAFVAIGPAQDLSIIGPDRNASPVQQPHTTTIASTTSSSTVPAASTTTGTTAAQAAVKRYQLTELPTGADLFVGTSSE